MKDIFCHNKKTNKVDKSFQEGITDSITMPTTEKLDISTRDYIVEDLENYIKIGG